MNTINFNKNDFPLATDVLAFLQASCQMLEKLTAFVGGNYILSGCEVTGTAVNPGHVVINGELMPFRGGTLQEYARVVTNTQTVTIQDGDYTVTRKELQFGAGSGQIGWNTLRRAGDLLSKIEGHKHAWSEIEGKPRNFPPENHRHSGQDLPDGGTDEKGAFLVAKASDIRDGRDYENRTPISVLPSHIRYYSGDLLRRTIINIGSWDMKNKTMKNIEGGVGFTKIRRVTASIIPDDQTWLRNLDGRAGAAGFIDGSNVTLMRFPGGDFDSENYSSTSINRGFVIIEHIL